jgi:hypothetical protein
MFFIYANNSFTYLIEFNSSMSSNSPSMNCLDIFCISYCYSGVYGSYYTLALLAKVLCIANSYFKSLISFWYFLMSLIGSY